MNELCQTGSLGYDDFRTQFDHRANSRGGCRFESGRLIAVARPADLGAVVMEYVSAEEKVAMERQREELFKAQIDVQDRIRKAASLGDLSENAEYHFAKEENRSIQAQLAKLEAKIKSLSVVNNDDVPENVVFIGHKVKLLDLDDESESVVHLVGQAQPPSADNDVIPVSANSPMGEALMKARVGDTIKVKAPRGTMEFKVLEILS